MPKTIPNKLNGRKTNAAQRKLAQAILDDPEAPISHTLVESGYTTPRQAKKGWAAVPDAVTKMVIQGATGLPAAKCDAVLKTIPKQGQRLAELGKNLTAEQQEHVVRGRLFKNVMTGQDKGAQSAKLLGSDRRVNMFTPDNQTGVIVLNCPQELLDRKVEMLAAIRERQSPAGHWATVTRSDGATAQEWVPE
jgi:hypothetical protein